MTLRLNLQADTFYTTYEISHFKQQRITALKR